MSRPAPRTSLAASSNVSGAACRGRRRSFAAGRGCISNGHSTLWRGLSRCGGSGSTKAPERLLFPEELNALEEPGRDLRSRDGDADRLERLARGELEFLC